MRQPKRRTMLRKGAEGRATHDVVTRDCMIGSALPQVPAKRKRAA